MRKHTIISKKERDTELDVSQYLKKPGSDRRKSRRERKGHKV